MKKILLFIVYFISILLAAAQRSPIDKVDPLIGTDSDFDFSNGNTYPAISLPWGMNCWSAQTINLPEEGFFNDKKKIPYWWDERMKDGWFYTYQQHKIKGIKQTHQPSVWLTDYGSFSLFAETGALRFLSTERASLFSHKTEVSKPYYYSVYLADYDVTAEVTPTDRAASFSFTFPQSDSSYILLDALDKGSYIKIIPEQKKIIGYCQNNSGGVPKNFRNYFVLYFDKDFETTITWKDSSTENKSVEAEGLHVMAAVKFKTTSKELVHIKVASSFISYEQAELNLQREIGKSIFEQVKTKAKNIWDAALSKIEVSGGTDAQTTIFYTAMYRSMLFPRKFYELDSNNKIIHYSPYNGKVMQGYLFTDVGFWDTFRGLFPFLTLIYPEIDRQMISGLENAYKESGWLPEWASPGHRDCMIGSHSASVIADAYLKGIRGFDINTLYEAILKSSKNEGPIMSIGRSGVNYYNTLGYVPYDVSNKENAAKTIEYSYDDYCIMQLAKALHRPQSEIDTFATRAFNYRNVFDTVTNFMRGKNKEGDFQSPFNPEKWGDAFTEGNSWHYTFSVFHDPEGLIKMMGSRQKFIEKLDSLFIAPPLFDYSYYGYQIHEINEMLSYHMGQYAHGNEPMHHAVYLYDWAGEPWKTQYWSRLIMNRLYTAKPDGLCGDEDNGQTSVWFVLSAMGFYSVCPGSGQWAIGSPLFKKIKMRLPNNKIFIINARNNNERNIYINTATLNGNVYTKDYLLHSDFLKGGLLNLEMSHRPNKNRGNGFSDQPYSMSKK